MDKQTKIACEAKWAGCEDENGIYRREMYLSVVWLR
jgi:hypothetical protein